ncbi:MAG: hypothetical protein K0V04_35730 [Deltaproteobacteria bacterium]|nr:hypothetical protein [Deltaproteobacteria bacterium]
MSPPSLLAPLQEHRRRLVPLGIALLLTFAYFVGEPAWNQNSRLALTRAMVEQRTTIIDRYHYTTGDKSFRDGHFYCDKAPGASWVAAVPYAAFLGLRRLTGAELPRARVRPLDPETPVPEPDEREPGDVLVYNLAHRMALYVCALFTGMLPSVAAAAAMFLLALRQTAGRLRPAAIVALTFALATPVLPYGTVLYGHPLCSALLLWAFTIVALTEPGQASRRGALTVGMLLGAAVATEYPAAVPTLVVVGLAAWRHGLRHATWIAVGGLPWVVALASYHIAAFGGPLQTGYDFVYREEFAQGMAVRYGIGVPDPAALSSLLWGSYRGLLYLSPVLMLAVWGLGAALRERDGLGRPTIVAAIVIVAFYLLLNAGYYMWDGGAAYGPRHLVPMLGLLMLGAVPALRVVPRVFVVLAVVGGLHMLLGAAATPEAPQHGNPVWEYAWGRVTGAEAGVPGHATNLGLLLGLPGLLSLLPLVVPWVWAGPAGLRREPTDASVQH